MVFLDTNILVYAKHPGDPRKQSIALSLMDETISSDMACISLQVVQEFCNVMLGKAKTHMKPEDLSAVLTGVLAAITRHSLDFDFFDRTIQLHQRNTINFYDAMIVQAALDLGCETLYSEDFQDGRKYGSLTVVNPFK